jgi:hypothetical protein
MGIDDVTDVRLELVENDMKDAVELEPAAQHNMLEVSDVVLPACQLKWNIRMSEQQRGEEVQLLADSSW